MSGPSIVQSTAAQPQTSATIIFTLTSTPSVGNVLVAFCSYSQFGNARTIGTPSGWVLWDNNTGAGGDDDDSMAIFTRVVQSGDSTGYTFNVSGATNDNTSGALYELTNVNTTTPINKFAFASDGGASTAPSGSVTPSVLNCLPMAAWSTDSAATESGITSGWTVDQSADGTFHTTFSAHQNTLTTDTVTPISVTLTVSTTGAAISEIILVAPAPAGGTTTSNFAPTNPGITWKRRFQPESLHLVPKWPAIGQIKPPYSPPARPINPGRVWLRRFQPESLHVFPPVYNKVDLVNQPAPVQFYQTPAQPGQTWKRRFKPQRQISTYQAYQTPLSQAIQEDGPIGWWKLNEKSGSTLIQDYSNNGWSISPGSTVFLGANTTPDQSGTSVYVTSTSALTSNLVAASTTGFTAEIWWNPADITNTGNNVALMASTAALTNYGFQIYYVNNTGLLEGSVGTGSTTIFVGGGAAPHPVNGWNHVALTYDGTNARLWLNGVNINTTATTGYLISGPAGSNTINLGKLTSSSTRVYGFLSNAAYYNYPLSTARIQAHYNAGNSSPNGAQSVIARPANPGKTWRRRFNLPEHLTPYYNSAPGGAPVNVNGIVSSINVVANFGTVNVVPIGLASQISVVAHITGDVELVSESPANVNVVANFGSVKVSPSESVSNVSVVTNFGTVKNIQLGTVSQVNAAAYLGQEIDQIPLPASPAKPGRVWSRRFRRHQVLPYRSAPNINITGLASTAIVTANFGGTAQPIALPAKPTQPGRTWIRKFRRHQVTPYKSASNISATESPSAINVAANFGTIKSFESESTATVNVTAYFGGIFTTQPIPLPASPVKPGLTWRRKFRRHQAIPLNTAGNKKLTGLSSTVAVTSYTGTLSDKIPGIAANVNAVANYGSLKIVAASFIRPINPGRTWKRRFRKPAHQQIPYKAFIPGTSVTGQVSRIAVNATYGSIVISASMTPAISVQAYSGTINYLVPVLKWKAKLLKPSHARIAR